MFAAHALASQAKKELTENILPYWTQKMCNPSGGFHGRITGSEKLDPEAPRGAIMNARLLWTFASAHRLLGSQATGEAGNACYLDMAFRAKREIIDKFYDPEHGGIYWSLDASGNPLDTKKQIYAIAFAIYGLSELYRACGDSEALEYAVKLFNDIEEHSFDSEKDGYFEAFTREWNTIGDMRLSDKDANESKTMNTHLHVLEAYTCLFRVWKDELLEKRLSGLIGIFERHILGSDGHLRLFFDNDWKCGYNIVSYGHDIEASWLIHEAALVLGDAEVLERVEKLVPRIAPAAGQGFTQDGGTIYEMH
ncbi:MAG: AGE family epimerase/isomerase, partial [Bacteroidales bacterium]|nr:AGE family epimerase/isomerase [Bacteroidales bacterium]